MKAVPLKIVSITPRNGPLTGGVPIVIEGTGFIDGIRVSFGSATASSVNVESETSLNCTLPSTSRAGYADVILALPDGKQAIQKNAFMYEASLAPVIRSVTPSRGPTAGGIDVQIHGENFVPASQVLIDGKRPMSVILIDANTLEIMPPPGNPGQMVDITVKNPDGSSVTAKRAFTYDARFNKP